MSLRSLPTTPKSRQNGQGLRSPTRSQSQKRFSLIGNSQKRYSQPVPIIDDDEVYTTPRMSSYSPDNDDNESYNYPSSPDAGGADRAGADISLASMDADYHIKIVCVGDGGCGKTCMLTTYAHGYFPEKYVPTVFENYLNRVQAPNGKIVELALWDTAGQEEYDRLRALSYPEVDVLLICFSVDSPPSLDNIYDKWLPEVSHYCPDIPFILVALKTDLRNDLTTIQHLQSKGQVPLTPEDGKHVAKKCHAVKYLECCAKTGQGVAQVFETAISVVIKGEGFRRQSSFAMPISPMRKSVDSDKLPVSPTRRADVQRKPVQNPYVNRPNASASEPKSTPMYTSSGVKTAPIKRSSKKKKCVIL